MSTGTAVVTVLASLFVIFAALVVVSCVATVRNYAAGRPDPHRTRGNLDALPVTRGVMLAWGAAPRRPADAARYDAARGEVRRVMPDLAAQLDRLAAEWSTSQDEQGRRLSAAAARAANTGEAHAHVWLEDGAVPGVQVCPCGAMRALA